MLFGFVVFSSGAALMCLMLSLVLVGVFVLLF